MLDLKQFCGTDPFRPYLLTPFSAGDFSYATNGNLMVRIPRLPELPEQDKIAKWDAPLEGIETRTFAPLPHGPIPDVPESECEVCSGRGRDHECPDCECICGHCHGSGEARPKTSTTVRGNNYNIRYVAMMLALPGAEPAEKTEEGKPLLFKFDGGVGAIMPLRGKYNEHIEIETGDAKAA